MFQRKGNGGGKGGGGHNLQTRKLFLFSIRQKILYTFDLPHNFIMLNKQRDM
jgi:hypothetical protein